MRIKINIVPALLAVLVTLVALPVHAADELSRLASAADGIDRNPLIQRSQFTFIANSQAQEIDIRDLRMGDDRIRFKDFQNAQIFRPKIMAG